MTQIIIDLDDASLRAALATSQKRNISLDELISEALRLQEDEDTEEVSPKPLVGDLVQTAISAANKIEIGKIFHLDELFTPDEWESLGPGDRKSLGKIFRREIEEEGIAEHVGRTSANKAKYKRN